MKRIYVGKQAWNLLNGVVCLYKPKGLSLGALERRLRKRLCGDLNALAQPKLRTRLVPIEKEDEETGEMKIVGEERQLDYSLHPLVIGPNYQPHDIRLASLHTPDEDSSGLTVVGIGSAAVVDIPKLRETKYLSEYEVVGKLGKLTESRKEGGRVTHNLTFDHVSGFRLKKLLAKIQGLSSGAAIKAAGAHPESRAAYELACKGPIRPKEMSEALFYSAELRDIRKPWFTLSLTVVNETDAQILEMIHHLGISLKAGAVTVKLRRLRHGHFTLSHALLEKYWTLENILRNMALCRPLLSPELLSPSQTVGQDPLLPPPDPPRPLVKGLREVGDAFLDAAPSDSNNVQLEDTADSDTSDSDTDKDLNDRLQRSR